MGNGREGLPLAALEHADDEHDMEDVLERVARRLQAEGAHVGGLVHRVDDYPSGSKRMVLFDLRSNRSFELSQDLGGASVACNLNPQALGEASAVLRQALADGVDLVVINRFGGVEAEGGGFVMEFADFIEAGIPVLTAVAARHQSGWQRFTGGLHAALPADEEALMAWCRAQLARRKQEGALKV